MIIRDKKQLFRANEAGKLAFLHRRVANFLAIALFFSLLPIAASAQVSGSEAGQAAAQEASGPQNGAVDEKDVRPLEQGQAVRRELSGGQRHSYQLRLSIDQFLKATIEQQGIDVVVKILGPDGKQIVEFDTERRPQGKEEASLVAETAGDYRLVVQPSLKGAAAGSYEIRIAELRALTDDERALLEAKKLNKEIQKLHGSGKYDEALALAQRALEFCERKFGPDHREVAAALQSLAILYAIKSEYAKAEPLFQRALLIVEKALGPDHLEVAVSLNNLAILYKSKGEYAKAEPLYQRAQLIREKAFGSDHPEMATSLNNLANFYVDTGKYSMAEPLYLRAIIIKEKVLGKDHPIIATLLNNLAILYFKKGDFEKAESLDQRALLIREKALGPDHLEVANSLNNHSNYYTYKGMYVEAERLLLRALRIKEKALGPEHPVVANTLSNIAGIYFDQGDYLKAESFYQRALSIEENKLGPNHPQVAHSLNNLAVVYFNKGDYAKAEPLYQRALSIRENVLGLNHPDVGISLYYLAVNHALKGDIAQAITLQLRATELTERNLDLNLTLGSERQKLIYLARISKQTNFTVRLHSQVAPYDPQALNMAFTTVLRRKGRGLDAMANTIATLRRHSTPEVLNLFDQLTDARSQLAALILRESDSAKSEDYQARIKPLEEKIDNLEAELSARSAEFRAQTQPVTLSAVQAALPADSALIEFVTYTPRDPRTDKSQPPRYLAYLLAAQGQPKWVDLGEAAPIEQALAAWRQSLREISVDVKQLGRAVDKLVMQPVRALLGSESGRVSHLLIAPDGALNLIPFAALVDEENRYLIEGYTISYLTSGRDLLRLRNRQPSKNAPLVLANPLFGNLASAQRRETGNQGERRSDPARIFFRQLPGTESEALAIKSMLPEASVLLQQQATETALKQVIGPRILHIATHGFFIDNQEPIGPAFTQGNSYTVQLESDPELERAQESIERLRTNGVDAYIIKSKVKSKGTFFRVRSGNFPTEAEAQNYGAGLQEKGVAEQFYVARYKPPQEDLMGPAPAIAQVETKPVTAANLQTSTETFSDLRLGRWAAQIENPLLRSGLALSGANRGNSGDDDGLLTALEVAGLDLWGTKLVVLSACDTGLGEIKNGEGVLGLRRALVLAGSESQVISLWAVKDELAREVIIPYYKAVGRGEGRGEGLRQVQLRMLRSRDRRHPFYWAAFIQSGDWMNLDGRR